MLATAARSNALEPPSICDILNEATFAVTFDAPGCDYLLELPGFNGQNSNNIINYVTTPNLVNTGNRHVGEIRRISSFPEVNKEHYRKYGEVPLKLEIINLNTLQQLLSTLESHCLEKIITSAEKLSVFRYEKVYKWPNAKNKAIYQEWKHRDYYYFPGGDLIVNVGYGLFQLASSITSGVIWDMTKKTAENGTYEEGLVAIEHERNDLIFYTEEAYDNYSLKEKEPEKTLARRLDS